MDNREHVMKPSEDQHSGSESGVAGGFCPHSQEYKEPPHVCFEQKNAGDLPESTETWSNDHLPIDIILLTVENCDFFSCFSLLDKPFKSYKKEIGYVYFGGIGDTSDQEKLKIALVKCHKGPATPGGSLAAILNAVRVLRPKAVFSVGTCISLDLENVKMGDVVISCKLTAEGFRTPVSRLLSRLIRDASLGWVAPLRNPDEMEVKVHCDGDILSQSQRENCRCDDIWEQYPGAVAIETEGIDLYAAGCDASIEWVIVKGVASYFHQSQAATSEWMSFASTMAASVVAKMLKDPTVFREWPHYNQGVRYGTSDDQHSMQQYGAFDVTEGKGCKKAIDEEEKQYGGNGGKDYGRGAEDKHRTILRDYRSKIVMDLEPNNILPNLGRLLNEMDEVEIKAQSTRRERCEKLLEILPRKGPNAFKVFVEALEGEAPHLVLDLIHTG